MDWAIEKDGYWYIVSGAEFPEKRYDRIDRRLDLIKKKAKLKTQADPRLLLIVIAAFLGISIGLNLFLFIL